MLNSFPSSGDLKADAVTMWRKGYAPLGYSAFNSSSSKIKDAFRWGKKINAKYIIIGGKHVSSSTSTIPITMPNTTTSYNQGAVNAYGSGGTAYGNYSGTTTTYGSRTTYIPVTNNIFYKMAVYFGEYPKKGDGIYSRALTDEEIARYETQRGVVVSSVREGSPAYNANILPGDVIIKLNDQPFDMTTWNAALAGDLPLQVELVRNGSVRNVALAIPSEWNRSDAPTCGKLQRLGG